MKQLHDLAEFHTQHSTGPICLAIGAFDGIHIGHQALLRATVETATACQGEAWCLTFDPHPSRVLRSDQAPLLLTNTALKLHLLEGLGLTGCILQPFTMDMAKWEPLAFLNWLHRHIPNLHALFVGFNWRFGHGATGDVTLLTAWTAERGIDVIVPDPVLWEDEVVSSTRIRQAVEAGALTNAEALLGRPFTLRGVVQHGRKIGRELGFPTANIPLFNEITPPIGVYAALANVEGTTYRAAAYLGRRPANKDHGPYTLLEVHLFDVERDLYGKTLEVTFLEFLRKDQRFSSQDTLIQQINSDIQRARDIHARTDAVS